MGTHASVPHNPGIANAFFRAGMIEAWGRGIGHIVSACRAAGTAEPHWELESDGVRLEFVFVGTANRSVSRRRGPRARRTGAAGWPDPAVAARVAARVTARVAGGQSAAATGRWPDVEVRSFPEPGAEERLRSAQQGNRRAPGGWQHWLHHSRQAPKPTSEVPPDGRGTGCRRRAVRRRRRGEDDAIAGQPVTDWEVVRGEARGESVRRHGGDGEHRGDPPLDGSQCAESRVDFGEALDASTSNPPGVPQSKPGDDAREGRRDAGGERAHAGMVQLPPSACRTAPAIDSTMTYESLATRAAVTRSTEHGVSIRCCLDASRR